MAEEAFALSPISARASLPSEADYDAIREAFMETARGRWFLSEYSKRNRNADTRMVLDAVGRIEQTLAAQKQAAPTTTSLIDVLAAIRGIVADAKARAAEAMSQSQGEDILKAAHEGARIVREIAWTLRECGADARICDLLDTQVSAIDAGHRQVGAPGSRDAVLATFDSLLLRISELADGSAAASLNRSSPASPSTPPRPESPAAEPAAATAAARRIHELVKPAAAPVARAAPVAEVAPAARVTPVAPVKPVAAPVAEIAAGPSADEIALTAQLDQLAAIAQAPSFEAPAESTAPTPALDRDAEHRHQAAEADADLAQDLVLEAIALEMAAPDYSEPEGLESDVAVLERQETEVAAPPAIAAIAEPTPPPAPSLGAALIARGMVTKPPTVASDLLAPIRRMSQAERIAFFS